MLHKYCKHYSLIDFYSKKTYLKLNLLKDTYMIKSLFFSFLLISINIKCNIAFSQELSLTKLDLYTQEPTYIKDTFFGRWVHDSWSIKENNSIEIYFSPEKNLFIGKKDINQTIVDKFGCKNRVLRFCREKVDFEQEVFLIDLGNILEYKSEDEDLLEIGQYFRENIDKFWVTNVYRVSFLNNRYVIGDFFDLDSYRKGDVLTIQFSGKFKDKYVIIELKSKKFASSKLHIYRVDSFDKEDNYEYEEFAYLFGE